MSRTLRKLVWPGRKNPDDFLRQEWLVTNGLGGYASGTIAGLPTRRFHGLLVAALPAPLGRIMMLNHLRETLQLANGRIIELSGEEPSPGRVALPGAEYLAEFRLEMGLPVWRFEIDDLVFEKRIVMPHHRNTVHAIYKLLASSSGRHASASARNLDSCPRGAGQRAVERSLHCDHQRRTVRGK